MAQSAAPSQKNSPNEERIEKIRDAVLDFVIKYGMIVAILFSILYFSFEADAFMRATNLLNIIRASSMLIIVAIGVTLSVAVGGFDVSVGSVASLSSMLVIALMVIWEWTWYAAMAGAISAGLLIGIINSFLVIQLRIPDLLATLGMLYFADGLHRVVTKGEAAAVNMANPWKEGEQAQGEVAKTFEDLGGEAILKIDHVPQWLIDVAPNKFFVIIERRDVVVTGFQGIPYAVIFMLVIAIAFHIFLQYTRWGRMIYAVGSNQEAARLSGIPVNRVRLMTYMLSGLLAATGGVLLASRTGRGAIGAGADFLLDAVAATFFGFAVLGARKPNVFGTVLGALFVGILLNGLTKLGIADFYQDVIKGSVLIASLALSFYLFRTKD